MIKGNSMVQSKNYSDGKVSRTKVGRHFKFRSTFNSAYLIPFWCDEVYPGQFKSVDLGELVRSITPLGPTMDNSFLDVFFFFVPYRLVWDHWEEFIAGYNKEAWTQDVVYQVPQIKFKNRLDNGTLIKEGTADEDTILELGLPYGSPGYVAASGTDPAGSEYDPNIFIHSWMDYLPGYTDPVTLAGAMFGYQFDGDTSAAIVANYNVSALYPRAYVKIWNDWFRDENLQDEIELYTGDNDEYADEFAFNLLDATAIPKAAKYHNRFTSALPGPVKGPDVLIPMTNLEVGSYLLSDVSSFSGQSNRYSVGALPLESGSFWPLEGNGSGLSSGAKTSPVVANNVSNTIRMLRLATQTELLLARDARGGTRYVESLLSHFGVHNGDARLQRSEYLGSKQIPLNIMQVTNTAGTVGSPLGNVGGQSVTKDNSHYFSKAFSEHGVVFCVACVRTNLSYSSGIQKQYKRKDRFDFIWPEFKHIGDVPLYLDEHFIGGEGMLSQNANNRIVFGYTPYGSELRDGFNFNNGLFRADADGSLSYLTYQEQYDWSNSKYPTLSEEYIKQSDVIRNTLTDQTGPEFYALFDLYSEDVIPLDPTSDPGLMDHF